MPRINNAQNFRGQFFATQKWVNENYLLASDFKCVTSIGDKQGEIALGKYITFDDSNSLNIVVNGKVEADNEGLVTGGAIAAAIKAAVDGKTIGVESIDGKVGALTTGDYLTVDDNKVLTLTVVDEIDGSNAGLATGIAVHDYVEGKFDALNVGVTSFAGQEGAIVIDDTYLTMEGTTLKVNGVNKVDQSDSNLVTSGAVFSAIAAAKKVVEDAKYVKWEEVTETVGETGVDTAIPTQKAVRTAINAMKSAIDSEKIGLVAGEAIKVEDVSDSTSTNKKIDVKYDNSTIVLDAQGQLSSGLRIKKVIAASGYAASYQLVAIKDEKEVTIGDQINILKDQFLKSVQVVWSSDETEMKNLKETKEGDSIYAFLEMTIYTFDGENEPTQSIVYVPVNELFTAYEAGKGITINSNTISITEGYVEGLIDASNSALKGKVQTALDTLANSVEGEINDVATDLATKATSAINAVDTAVATFKGTVDTALSTTATNVNTAVSGFKTSVDTALGNVNTAVSGFKTSVNTALSTTATNVNTAVSNFKTSVDTALSNVNGAFKDSYVIKKVTFTFGDAVKGVRAATVDGEVMATYQNNKLAYPQVEITTTEGLIKSTISADFGDQSTGSWSALVAKSFVPAVITTAYEAATAGTAEFTEATVTTTYANATAGTSTYNSAQADIKAEAADDVNVTIA